MSDVIQTIPEAELKFGDIAVVVVYQPWFILLRQEKIFRFFTHREISGNIAFIS